MDRIRRQLSDLKIKLAVIHQCRNTAINRHATLIRDAETEIEKTLETQATKLTEKLDHLKTEGAQKRKELDDRWSRRAARVKSAAVSIKSKLDKQMVERATAWEERRKEAQAQAAKDHSDRVTAHEEECSNAVARLDGLSISGRELRDRLQRFAQNNGVRFDAANPDPGPETPPNPEETANNIEKRIADTEVKLLDAHHRLSRKIPPIAVYFLIIAISGAVFGALQSDPSLKKFAAPAVGVLLLIASHSLYSSRKEKVRTAAMAMARDLLGVGASIDRQKAREHDRNMAGLANLGCERVLREVEANEEVQRQASSNNRPLTEAMGKLQTRRDKLIERILQEKKARAQKLEQETTEAANTLRVQNDQLITRKRDVHAAKLRDAEKEKTETIAKLANDWKATLENFGKFVDDENRKARETHPAWRDINFRELKLPAEFIKEVPIGTMNLNVSALANERDKDGPFSITSPSGITVPVNLTFPLQGSLLVRTSQRREEAMKVLLNTVLRLLTSCPPSKAKLTIIDPVGLGQSFAGLMHLADYDESLVNGKIWSDGAHIERKLTELTEHMEKVIQKYLRNRYASIDEYNREAGQLAEPYRFLVIADFPTGFSEVALDRLASIVKSGVRCGVYTIILQHDRQKVPAHIDVSSLTKNGVVLAERGDGFVVDDEALNRAPFELGEAPKAQQVDELVNAVGKQCSESARVQVPFDVVMPPANDYWSQKTDYSVRIPLGKSGADRLQHMELGKGTAQHALIAGKTGSGKSNLFHVIVTNAASWYSPQELEFYLVDFKKGVEFKTYGVHRLRHARVVAIESDREFALSVLKRIDRELTNRGELFRKARVQDFPSFRKAASETLLPRTLLMIDEFQEFFTDDDEVAQDAALLLDRIVRQGRAFGIHVILGSQTLGGTYTLSKSTLGQIVVRIALQCNEADSYLILSDENSAATLLTRPGEAIYNDQSGLVEGNNPFQAVYLPKEFQDKYLSVLQRKAVEDGVKNVEPLVVFEGNSLADIRNNLQLRSTALQDPMPRSAAPRAFFGEPNAIKGPTEAEFSPQAGSNLLCVGHRGDTDLAMCCASVLSLAAEYSPDDISIRILDGSRADSPARERLDMLAKVLPYDIQIGDYRRAPQMLTELGSTIKTRQQPDNTDDRKIFVFVLGLEKFRMLRQEDEFSFSPSSDEEAGPSPSKAFMDILTEGPNAGINSMIWCDTLGNLNRALSRKALREFESRILFQMSASDSSELIDTPAANRLGMYNAMLFSLQSGGVEKFRPYAPPDSEIIEEFGRILSTRAARIGARTKIE